MNFSPRSFLSLSLALLASSVISCSAGRPDEGAASGQGAEAQRMHDGSATAFEPTAEEAANNPSGEAEQSQDNQYQLLAVKDPDFSMVAYALKIPRGWPAKQVFQRQWDGANPRIESYVVFRSGDAKQQIEYLPASQYIYSDGPGPNNLRMQKQAMGIDSRMAENELAPMPALAYLKNIVLPEMARNGLTLTNTGNEQETPPHTKPTPGSDKPHMASGASVDGTLPNGNQARIEVRLGWNEMRNNQDVFYSWWATPSIIQTGNGDLAATYAHAETARESVLYNPQWLQKNADLMSRASKAASETIMRNHAASMDNIAQWGRINKANAAASMARINSNAAASAERQQQQNDSFNSRMASNDRNNELFADVVINGEAKYANPTTGERIKVDSSYNHTYTDNNGSYYQSNTPLTSNEVNWQEMQKVPFDDY